MNTKKGIGKLFAKSSCVAILCTLAPSSLEMKSSILNC